jgi:long-chain acyl-CoA synthetase
MSLSLASIVTESARRFPLEVALIQDRSTWNYSDLKRQSFALSGYLCAQGIRPGMRIGLMCGNCAEFTLSYFGILAAGATVVSLNTLLVPDEISYQLDHSEVVGLLVDSDCLPTALEAVARVPSCRWVIAAALDQAGINAEVRSLPSLGTIIQANEPLETFVPTRPDDTAVVMYTSGTTGKPKGAELTHFNLWENARIVSERGFAKSESEVFPLGPGQVALAVLPLFHSFGQTCVQNALLFNGGAITYLKRFDPLELAQIAFRDKVTILNAVPTIYNAMLHEEQLDPDHLTTLRYGISGGAPLPLETRKIFEDQFGMPIQEGYGLTETSPVACTQTQWLPRKNGSIGRPISGVEMKIFDTRDQEVPPGTDGEVVIRGRNLMKGYLKNPEATANAMRSGWFHSGDIGRIDPDGDFYIVDRKKDMIIRGGFNIYPREVEEVLYTHPDILEASVIGVPDPYYGEEIKAVIALREGVTIQSDQLIAFCKERVAAFKYPRIIEFIDELPKGSTGKILKREIRRLYAERRTEAEK